MSESQTIALMATILYASGRESEPTAALILAGEILAACKAPAQTTKNLAEENNASDMRQAGSTNPDAMMPLG